MGDGPILPVIQPITIHAMLNWITDRYFKVKNQVEFRYTVDSNTKYSFR